MKNMKVLILVFGLLGVASLFIPMEGFTMFAMLKALGMGYLVPVLGGFALAAIMGVLGLANPPAQQWQAIAAVAGFAVPAVRMKIWSGIVDGLKGPLPGKLMIIAILGGIVVSVLALMKPESKT